MATITTEIFKELAEHQARLQGMPHLSLVVVPHPIGGLREEVVTEIADKSLGAVEEALLAPRNIADKTG